MGMEKMFSVPLKGGAYTDVFSISGIENLREVLQSYGDNSLFVADANTACYLPSGVESIILPPGEKEKNWASVDRILSKALSIGMARDSVFVAVGGGVILDMTAFASSLYMRGARTVLVPTTLLSMVDATLGGKTGIDYGGGKNLVGTFYPAESVMIASDTLKTLPDREYKCGLGEVVKHAFLSSDRRLHDFLDCNKKAVMERDSSVLGEMIRLSLEVKIEYITKDPEEKKGIRQALNLGHTFAHALETVDNFGTKHGMAVAWGLSRAAWCGVRTGVTDPSLAEKVDSLLRLYGYDIDRRIERGRWIDYSSAVSKDKKNISGTVRFVLLEDFGRPVLRELDSQIVREAVLTSAGVQG